jgi:hypothetical protein
LPQAEDLEEMMHNSSEYAGCAGRAIRGVVGYFEF